MSQSIRSFNITPLIGQLLGIWTFEDWFVQIISPWGRYWVQMPYLRAGCEGQFFSVVKGKISDRDFLLIDHMHVLKLKPCGTFFLSQLLTKVKLSITNQHHI